MIQTPFIRRFLVLATAFGLNGLGLSGCSGKSGPVERLSENGVEVVLNHLEPYALRGEPARLYLDKEYALDTESRDILEKGMTDIRALDVDSQGHLYILQPPRSSEFLVFRFDDTGRFERSLVRRGSGPGEVQWPFSFVVNARDELQVFDSGPGKLLTFAPSGDLLNEIPFRQAPGRSIPLIPLANGLFLSSEHAEGPGAGATEWISLSIYDREFTKIRTFSRFQSPARPELADKISAYTPSPMMAITSDRIHLGYPGETYEILVHDLEGNLLRIIRKDHRPVPITEGMRKAVLDAAPKGSPIVERLYFPSHKPAFQFLFADDTGRLFAMTSEVDEATGQNVCDVFNRDGVFVSRVAIGYFDYLRALFQQTSLIVLAKHGRMYVLREKESGFKELVVYRAEWR